MVRAVTVSFEGREQGRGLPTQDGTRRAVGSGGQLAQGGLFLWGTCLVFVFCDAAA